MVPIPIIWRTPYDLADLLGRGNVGSGGLERKDQVVVQVKRLPSPGRDSVDIDANQLRRNIRNQLRSGLFQDLAAGRVPDFRILQLHMTAGEEPSIQAAVVHQKKRILCRMKD